MCRCGWKGLLTDFAGMAWHGMASSEKTRCKLIRLFADDGANDASSSEQTSHMDPYGGAHYFHFEFIESRYYALCWWNANSTRPAWHVRMAFHSTRSQHAWFCCNCSAIKIDVTYIDVCSVYVYVRVVYLFDMPYVAMSFSRSIKLFMMMIILHFRHIVNAMCLQLIGIIYSDTYIFWREL